MKECILYKKNKQDDSVLCQACAWNCNIFDGNIGQCGIRTNVGGRLNLTVWGRPAVVATDSIEKKGLFHYLPGSKVLSVGTFGCNFNCDFCPVTDISQILEKKGKADGLKMADYLSGSFDPLTLVDFARKEHIPVIAFTFTEPAIFAEYAESVMREALRYGIKGIYLTNGYLTPEAIEYSKDFISGYLVNLFSFSKGFYQEVCRARLEPVLEAIKNLALSGRWLEITTPIITGKNDSSDEIKKMAEFIASINISIPWHLTAVKPGHRANQIESTSVEKLVEAREIARAAGLRYVYTNNFWGIESATTSCPACNHTLFERVGGEMRANNLLAGRCPECGITIPGVWG